MLFPWLIPGRVFGGTQRHGVRRGVEHPLQLVRTEPKALIQYLLEPGTAIQLAKRQVNRGGLGLATGAFDDPVEQLSVDIEGNLHTY